VLLGLAIGAWLAFSPPEDRTKSPTADNPGFTVTAHDRTLGNPRAPLVLIEYAAPICPHCAKFEIEDFPVLKANYIDTGKIFYVFRVYPLRPDDGPAEKLARCVPKQKYFTVMDLLFRNQSKWDGAEYPDITDDHAGLILVARLAGLGPAQADKCMNDPALDDSINQVAQDGAQKYNITGTPTFVLDGLPGMAGELWPDLRQRLDSALAARK